MLQKDPNTILKFYFYNLSEFISTIFKYLSMEKFSNLVDLTTIFMMMINGLQIFITLLLFSNIVLINYIFTSG